MVTDVEVPHIRVNGWCQICGGVGAEDVVHYAYDAGDLPARMRRLAFELSVGWDDEPNPDAIYVAYGQAFKEAARRILAELDIPEEPK